MIGNLKIETNEEGNISFTGNGTLDGNLVIDAPNASINSDLNVTGTTTIEEIADSTFSTTGTHAKGIFIKSGRLKLEGSASDAEITIIDVSNGKKVIIEGAAAKVIIDTTGSVEFYDATINHLVIKKQNNNITVINDSEVEKIEVIGEGAN